MCVQIRAREDDGSPELADSGDHGFEVVQRLAAQFPQHQADAGRTGCHQRQALVDGLVAAPHHGHMLAGKALGRHGLLSPCGVVAVAAERVVVAERLHLSAVLATVAGVALSLARPVFALPQPVYESIKLLGERILDVPWLYAG